MAAEANAGIDTGAGFLFLVVLSTQINHPQITQKQLRWVESSFSYSEFKSDW